MNTIIHYKREGIHRIMAIVGFFAYIDVREVLQANDIEMDDDRFMLEYTPINIKELEND